MEQNNRQCRLKYASSIFRGNLIFNMFVILHTPTCFLISSLNICFIILDHPVRELLSVCVPHRLGKGYTAYQERANTCVCVCKTIFLEGKKFSCAEELFLSFFSRQARTLQNLKIKSYCLH